MTPFSKIEKWPSPPSSFILLGVKLGMGREGDRGGEAESSVVLKHLFESASGLSQQLCVGSVQLFPFYTSGAILVGVTREKTH